MRLHDVGDTALLVEVATLNQVMGIQDVLHHRAPSGVRDIVAAARTVLVSCDSPATVQSVRQLLANASWEHPEVLPGTVHTIQTVYDGADLTEAARLTGLSVEALLSWHSGQQWRAAFCGFAPGFMYLTPLDEPLNIPRRASPRTVVPTGSVAVGGEFSAIYPGPSPGGWQLLGRCAETLWDTNSPAPALLQPGDTVQFKPVRELIARSESPVLAPSMTPNQGLKVLAPGAFTTVQDLGRPGFAHMGVTTSGALDRAALRRANRMVGNSPGTPGAAGLEVVLTGFKVAALGSQVLAVSGSTVRLSITAINGSIRETPANAPFVLADGEVLSFLPVHAPTTTALRSYLAVRGGFSLPEVLGSQSTDMLSGLGPPVVTSGMVLPVAVSNGIVDWPEDGPPGPAAVTELRFFWGPRDDWFTPESLTRFQQQSWRISPASNRIGLRLEPTHSGDQAMERNQQALAWELPSEGMVVGAIQVPPSGMPVLFLADHPVTGGYPVLGVVLAADLDQAAALTPGATVRFKSVQ